MNPFSAILSAVRERFKRAALDGIVDALEVLDGTAGVDPAVRLEQLRALPAPSVESDENPRRRRGGA